MYEKRIFVFLVSNGYKVHVWCMSVSIYNTFFFAFIHFGS